MDLPSIAKVPAAVTILAAAAGTLLIFMAASFPRRGKMTTPSDDTGEDVLRCRQDLGDEEDQEDIFLSHSGRQKNFTEHLYDALTRANHSVFFDKHTLPIASPFPANIKKALRGCKLGVLVLSEDFLTSKWPMVELGILFENGIEVLPLFFMLNTEDLKSPKNLSRWRKKWKTMAKNQQQAEQWENAVKKLHTMNGIVYKHQESEVAYINKVVTKICNFIRPYPVYDQSNIQGSRALAKEIAEHFYKLDNANQWKRACVVGLHGVGGQGKTTLCKTMVNFFHSKYLGRSSYIEFPTDYDQRKVVEECKKAMKQLFHLGEESLKADGFDQVVGLMKQHVKKFDVFLGIDNIWEHSIEDADRLLKIGFSANSKVLLTSRSKGVLQTLLSGCADNSDFYHHLDPLPAPDNEAAFQIFKQSVKHDDFFSSSLRNQIKDVLYRCGSDGKYHPLALKALGAYSGRLCGLESLKRSRSDWPSILRELQNADLQGVDRVIRLNYESLKEVQQHMFLDIVLFLTKCEDMSTRDLHENVWWWLRNLYRELREIDIRVHIYDLAMAGVVNIGDMEDIEVHDMYKKLARKEMARSPRFLTSMKEAMEGKERGSLKRVFLQRTKEKIELRQCEEVEFLYASGVKAEDEIYPESMPSLLILVLLGLRWMVSSGQMAHAPEQWAAQKRKLNLKELVHLEYLELCDCCLDVEFGGENALQNLRVLSVSDCAGLEDVDSLRYATQLEALFIKVCPALKRLPDLGGLSGLKILKLEDNSSLEELGYLSPTLEMIIVDKCRALKKLPDLHGLTSLEILLLSSNSSLEEVGCLSSPALRTLGVQNCVACKRMPDLGGLTGLEKLIVSGNDSLEELGSFSPALKNIQVAYCQALKTIPDLGGLTGLESLDVSWNHSLKEIGCISPAIERMMVYDCRALKRIANVGGLTRLESLVLHGNDSLKEVGGLSSLTTGTLLITQCRKVAALGTLKVMGRGFFTEETWPAGSIVDRYYLNYDDVQYIRLEEVGTVRTLNLKKLWKLERLEVAKCEALEEIQGLDKLMHLKRIMLRDCGRLDPWAVECALPENGVGSSRRPHWHDEDNSCQ